MKITFVKNEEKMNTSIQDDNSCFKHLHSCFCLKSLLNINHQIHPTNPSGSKHSEFLVVDNKKTLRIIHIKPDLQISRINYDNHEKCLSMSRHSLTEEYWFTRWSKPLRAGSCNCSFRRSQRYSKLSNQFNTVSFSQLKHNHFNSNVDISSLDDLKLAATKITNIDTFVERLVQDTYFEALQEYLIRLEIEHDNRNQTAYDNKAYNVDRFDNVIVLRRPHLKDKISQSSTVQNTSNNNKDVIIEQPMNICSHKNSNNVSIRYSLVIIIHYAYYYFIVETFGGITTRYWKHCRRLVEYNLQFT